MNCERCQELIGDLIDGTLSGADKSALESHLDECLDCVSVRNDLTAILGFCREHRGEYEAPPNERALWLRIRNVIEAETASSNSVAANNAVTKKSAGGGWFSRSWELSLPQLAAFTAAIVVFVSIATTVGVRRWQASTTGTTEPVVAGTINQRFWKRQQVINYWNRRVELNRARWSSEMRATFDRNMSVIDQAVTESVNDLNRNPHDEVSEQMLNEALNDKLALLKEFSDL